ncbi:unnamed protein product [Effrenium voratum]|nr:unnamed protein product [Effrenium voratum]
MSSWGLQQCLVPAATDVTGRTSPIRVCDSVPFTPKAMSVGCSDGGLGAGGVSEAEVRQAANVGSFAKGEALLKASPSAVRITGRDGEAQVQSERGSQHYTVRLGRSGVSVAAKCSCVDSRTRGGLCKHGVAVALLFLQHGHPLPVLETVAKNPRKRPIATPQREKSEEVEEALPALKTPSFPAAPDVQNRFAKSAVRRPFFLRQLHSAALAGDDVAFVADLERLDLSEQEAAALLHKAILGKDPAGAERTVAALLKRREGRAAAAAGVFDDLRRTPLHAAVSAHRLGMCRALLAANADPNMENGNGLNALDLARRRKLDTSGDWRSSDPVQELLRQVMAGEN